MMPSKLKAYMVHGWPCRSCDGSEKGYANMKQQTITQKVTHDDRAKRQRKHGRLQRGQR
jgi:hypothetical protein